ncbi:Rieske (2Fe-2S) protein [Methylobacterium radiodurans]|uniref:Ferredoxin n=1 Tax=Methylobacterium radiodurans TaxID=2202828 RepID=A0A2U8VX60_9HYPH|nr:Rieske 2Fe-2S domain-containing protein [Methylobacterium radiodurans]AWN38377.1 ferredoxin [Methylobacterium radiodurans]
MSGQPISAPDGVPAPEGTSDSDHPRAEEAAWIRVAALAAFGSSRIVPVTVGGQPLLIVQDGDRIFALERTCPHEGADLARGRCVAGRLHCPHHQASFALADGAVSPGWSFRPLRTYPVRIVDGDLFIDAPDLIGDRSGAPSESVRSQIWTVQA